MENAGTLLIADDEALVRSSTRRFFKRQGYTVLEAEDGPAALRLIEARGASISVVILDLTMPEMDGLEVYRRLRAIEPELPVIFCSGYHLDDSPLDPTELGEKTEFMQKPFDMRALTEIVGRLCSRRSE